MGCERLWAACPYTHASSGFISTAMEDNTLMQCQHHVWSDNMKFSHLQIHAGFPDVSFKASVHQHDNLAQEQVS